MTLTILQALYLYLPAYFANMAPVAAAKYFPSFSQPVSSHLFGHNKTWRGFVSGFIAAFLVLLVQKTLYVQDIASFTQLSLLPYDRISVALFAFLFGIGALTGDLVKSYFKRRFSIAPGSPWIPFDQIDFIAGATLFIIPVYQLPLSIIFIVFIVTPLLHFGANSLAYAVGLKRVWW